MLDKRLLYLLHVWKLWKRYSNNESPFVASTGAIQVDIKFASRSRPNV